MASDEESVDERRPLGGVETDAQVGQTPQRVPIRSEHVLAGLLTE